jgi:hypothetical protein
MQFSPLRTDLILQLNFGRPILDWKDIPTRFFAMIYDSVSPRFNVSSRDFSVSVGNILGDVSARYSVFGGNNAIIIYSDRIVVQFSALQPNDYAIATEIIQLAHDGFGSAFDEIAIASFEYKAFEHLNLVGRPSSQEFLEQFRSDKLNSAFTAEFSNVDQAINLRFSTLDQLCNLSATVERSLLSASAVFVIFSAMIQQANRFPSFQEKYEQTSSLARKTLSLIGLESSEG